ncbi:MAG: hypothetical protein IJK98_10575, partial [Clostridia bacterium]|nr:hypothetical protein [Clostridia bacterium]
ANAGQSTAAGNRSGVPAAYARMVYRKMIGGRVLSVSVFVQLELLSLFAVRAAVIAHHFTGIETGVFDAGIVNDVLAGEERNDFLEPGFDESKNRRHCE